MSPSTVATFVCLLPKPSFARNPPPSSAGSGPRALCQLAPTVSPPQSVKGLRSFIGAYKVLGRVLPNCSDVVDPLECTLTGLQSNDKLPWDENLTLKFKTAQEHLSRHKSIVLPCSSDTLWIVTNGSVTKRGLGATVVSCANTKSPGFPVRLRHYQLLLL